METCDYVYIIQYLKILVPFLVSVIESHIFLGKKNVKGFNQVWVWFKLIQVQILLSFSTSLFINSL